MAPFDVASLSGTLAYALLFGAIGFAFGFVLELAGFGDTRKLAAQFYLRDMTVLKAMFTAIAVAMVLVFLASSFGLLDTSRVWVNPTYLWPGIVGGLVMGVGFVVGGFCPGTSLVGAATLKVDAILFVAGALVGVWLFGETVFAFEPWWLSSYMGRFTLPDWLGLPPGVVVLLVVVMALAMFWGAERIEARFRGSAVPARPAAGGLGLRRIGAAAIVAGAVLLAARGQPTPDQRYARSPALQQAVADRAPFASPAEVVALRRDPTVQVEVLDLRPEREWNLFHVGGARRVEPAALTEPGELKHLLDRPAFHVTFLASNGEAAALLAWKRLRALGVQNLYVVEGGVNRWLELYPAPACVADPLPAAATAAEPEALRWRIAYAAGASLPSSWPELAVSRDFRFPCEDPAGAGAHPAGNHGFTWPDHAYTRRVKLQAKGAVKGGCG
jgi:hypothetical protein